jgi:hypothetical protein
VRHAHFNEIVAWANGAAIQSQRRNGDWYDDDEPHWYPDVNYRVKPETIKYRVALFKRLEDGSLYTVTCDNVGGSGGEYDFSKKYENFVRWITDWIEVED